MRSKQSTHCRPRPCVGVFKCWSSHPVWVATVFFHLSCCECCKSPETDNAGLSVQKPFSQCWMISVTRVISYIKRTLVLIHAPFLYLESLTQALTELHLCVEMKVDHLWLQHRSDFPHLVNLFHIVTNQISYFLMFSCRDAVWHHIYLCIYIICLYDSKYILCWFILFSLYVTFIIAVSTKSLCMFGVNEPQVTLVMYCWMEAVSNTQELLISECLTYKIYHLIKINSFE